MKKKSQYYINEFFERYPKLLSISDSLISAIDILTNTIRNDGTILICGNGGSASDSDHIVAELMKGFVLKRTLNDELLNSLKLNYPNDFDFFKNNLQRGIKAISLVSHNALISAYSNDKSPDLIFAQQVLVYGRPGDTLLILSTSGNSKNVVYAAQIARSIGVKVISLTGILGGKMNYLSDVILKVPENDTFKIQEYHLPVYHCICLILENEFFGE